MDTRVDNDEESDNKGVMWDLEQKLDQPMDEEAEKVKNMYRAKEFSALVLLRFAYQSLGVVYGDLGTSPLYVFYNTFPHGVKDPQDVIGALSLIIYSLTLVPLLKYVFVVLRANDNGQAKFYQTNISGTGGTFALYSLLCRHAKIKTIPNQHRTDEELTTYSRSKSHEKSFSAKTKRWLEEQGYRKSAILILVLVGTCMVIGDGILAPSISVLSAAGGIKVSHPSISNGFEKLLSVHATGVVVIVAVVILVGLFSMQHYGTDKVSWLFAPIVLLWFLLIGGTEALFADLAHFPVSAVQLAFTVVVFPCLILAYSGQAAYLMNNLDHSQDSFYRSIPAKRYKFEMHSKVSMAWIVGLGPSLGLVRVPGVGLVYTELASGVPPMFSHFITNLPAINSVIMFICVKYLPVYTVPEEERFLIKRIGPNNFHMFRCVARYGYRDLHKKDDDFEKKLFDNLFMFVRLESMMEGCSDSDEDNLCKQEAQQSRTGLSNNNGIRVPSIANLTMSSVDSIVPVKSPPHVNFSIRSSGEVSSIAEVDEVEFLNHCIDAGVVHILGNTVVRASKDSGVFKKIAIDYIFAFLKKICRDKSVSYNVPHESLLLVGQIFYV
ncbi:unnamed protein product [Lupinus luteus]|uniref:Potassium transporter n=1 Tax=Lupinus luteus TaxID=3873 RepID=A0AAV1WAN2_LUPLU